MSNFFNKLVDDKLIEKWADTLDWLFDDNKFSKDAGWNGGYVATFTKTVKHLPYFSEKNYHYGKSKDITFPQIGEKFCIPTFYIHKGECEGRDLVRHIRNGIAHGRTTFYKVKSELYIQICDFGKEGNKSTSGQTAFLAMPMSYIPAIYKLYVDREKVMKNTKKTKRRK